MKKPSFLAITAGLFSFFPVAAQTPLDTYNSFPNTDPPEGWTYNLNINSGDLFYYGGSDNSPSLRLDATGEFAMVEFAESSGSLSYYVRSTGFSPSVAPGTEFSVQESVTGTNWTTLRVLDENNLNGDFTYFSDTPSELTRFIRFYYTNKASGSNIALDEVSITKATAGPDARLMVYRDDVKVLSGHTVVFSGEENLVLMFNNEGLDETLQISDVTITGPDAAAFSTIPAPATIAPEASDFYQINLNGVDGEIYEAQLQITTNDAYMPVYVINIIGHGGAFAAEPENNPFGFESDNIRTFGFDISWSHPAEVPDRYLVLQSSSAIPDLPEDGVDYDISEYIGDSRVVYNGSNATFSPRNIGAGTTYHYSVFAVNGSGDYCNYLQSEPLTGAVSTQADMIGDYYDGLNSQQPDFLEELSDLVFPHTQLEYLDYPEYLINEFEARDTTESRKVVTGYYSGFEYLFQDPFEWDVMSREHVFAHSWFATYEAFDEMEYTDYHNLFPVHNDSANIVRLNHPFGIVENEMQSFHAGKAGYNSSGDYVYEPRDFAKGRVARAVFYMLSCYNDQIGGSWSLPSSQEQELLKNWHFEFLPDGREMARNDYIHSIQGNRNPFIDSVYFACLIDFNTMEYLNNPDVECLSVSVKTVTEEPVVLFPNPNNGEFNIHWKNSDSGAKSVQVYDLRGQLVWTELLNPGQIEYKIHLSHLAPGMYSIQWQQDLHSGRLPLIIR